MSIRGRSNHLVVKTLTATQKVSSPNLLNLGVTDAASTALLMSAGSSSSKATTAVANKNFIEFRTESTATSGDSRGIYNRIYLAGAGVSGESLRSFTTISNVAAANAHGAHISLNFDATGSVTGQGIASRNTLHVPNAAMSGGTVAAVQAEVWADGASSDISGTTQHSVWRTVVGGNATGAATVVNFMAFDIPAALVDTGGMIDTIITTHTPYSGIPILINGTVKYLAVVSA